MLLLNCRYGTVAYWWRPSRGASCCTSRQCCPCGYAPRKYRHVQPMGYTHVKFRTRVSNALCRLVDRVAEKVVRANLRLGDAVSGQLNDGEVAATDRPFDLVEADADGCRRRSLSGRHGGWRGRPSVRPRSLYVAYYCLPTTVHSQ